MPNDEEITVENGIYSDDCLAGWGMMTQKYSGQQFIE